MSSRTELNPRKLVYKIPSERAQFRRDWWRIADAAKAWGVSWTTAADWIRYAGHFMGCKQVLLEGKSRSHMVRCIPPGTGMPVIPGRGNPRMQESEFQSQMARRRWGR